MKMWRAGLSMLEVAIATVILAVLVIPAFSLFSMQRHQVASAGREVLVHSYALQRLAEEESRLNLFHFASGRSATADVRPPGDTLSVREVVSVGPAATCTGLWKVTISLTYADEVSRGESRTLTLSKLVVDRELPTRLPAEVR